MGINLTNKKPPRTKKAKKDDWNGELVYIFRNVPVKCEFDVGRFSDAQIEQALLEIESLSREIRIDKTYVDFKGTRFEKTFLNESGWDALKDLVRETHYGLIASETVKEVMNETFGRMALEYVRMALRELGWNVQDMALGLDGEFDVEYMRDVSEEWKRYPGKWQTWEDRPGC